MIPPRFDVSEAQIEQVVARFYAQVRRHPVLGPVFNGHIHDWPRHEIKIAHFWKKSILHQRGYDGNPMRVHREAGDVTPQHFPVWLDLFDRTLRDTLPPEAAAGWSLLAHRIGRGLSLGLQEFQRPKDAPPVLR
ncbi:group III truncated hemoglobin [Paracoccus fistulariae]|uniref:Group III truncated hemoglobin n=1 Tax=Paracoccus fistulariae TaxID=658446 RepID=A0ABY7SL77_9RHOB|nr:group III truncated hemoglobin [Paracoccus fistulariae]MDB6182025.1 group III truncated hemoglobin [Paracoccus fistulariae]WCR06741.1 group III truncated hemoglobin [Paracoccus fistulariae]